MITLLLTYLITAHLFSGLFCYAISLTNGDGILSGHASFIKVITNIWIPLMWPVWMLSEIWRLNTSQFQSEFQSV